MENLGDVRKLFQEPPMEYRSAPFWAWNDRLREEELARQIKEMKDQGMGGFFMHSRDGLETVYMGPEWINCIKASVNAAKDAGMKAWLYDEDRWPSGTAGGTVPAKGDAFRAKGLTIEVRKGDFIPEDAVYALFKAEVDGMALDRCERLESNMPQTLEEGEVFLVFRIEVAQPSEWFNNEAPPDNLNPECIREFIKATHEPYKEAIGEEFGKTVPGIFTDEPGLHDRHCKFTPGRGWIPWTYDFSAFFTEKRGYDLLDIVPYVFFNGGHSAQARHDYWRTVMELFCSSYSQQLGQWCEENGLAFTGHFLWESNMGTSTRVGGAVMPHYRYQQVPGVDLLYEQIDETITMKQCTSVANQYGRKFVLSETYGCTGWDFTFEGQKWMGDWQYAMGVNIRSQHMALYSLRGCRKRDYPPVFSYNTSWWKYNHVVEDYFARIGAVMSCGHVVRELLVLHPASTAWVMLGSNPYGFKARGKDRDMPLVNGYGDDFNQFLRYLAGIHYDFDLGDETIMAETSSIAEGKILINRTGYRAVVPPPIQTLLKSTKELLLRFMESGGRIITVAPVATMIEGRNSYELEAFFGHPNMMVVKGVEEVAAALERVLPRQVSIRNQYFVEAPELLYMLRNLEDGKSLFVVNTDRNNAYDATITVEGSGTVEEWDPLTGEAKVIKVVVREGHTQIRTHFAPAGSRMYIVHKNKDVEITESTGSWSTADIPADAGIVAALGPVSRFTRTMPNLLILDQCAYQLEEDPWSETMEVWQAQRKIRDLLGMRQVYTNGLLQRYKWIYESHPMNGKAVRLKFLFEVKTVPKDDCYLVLEGAEDYGICLNGAQIVNSPEGWFLDKSFHKVKLHGLKAGTNELILSCSYLNRMEMEDCYLIGDFGVDCNRNIIAEPEVLHFGDWCMQGYFHYCGSMIYHFDLYCNLQEGEKAILELGEYSAVTVEIRVNGETAGYIPWRAANGLDITRLLVNGTNCIDIEVMGSPRNMLGPFHQARGHTSTTSCDSFRREGCEYTPEYVVKPYGLLSQVKIHRV